MLNIRCKKRIEAEKNSTKDGSVLYKLMSNGKIMEILGSRIDVKLVTNENDYAKWT